MNTLTFIRTNARWLVGGLLLTVFSSFGQTFFIALFGSEIRETFVLTHGEFGGIYMVGTLASAVTLVWLGRVVDIYPVGLVAVAVCTALTGACLLMATVSSAWVLVIVIFTLRLFGQGMMSHIAMVAMGRWYSAERGRAVAITSMGHQIGTGALPLLMVGVIAWAGWRGAWLLSAASLFFVAMPLIYVLMKTERIPRGQRPDSESDKGVRQWTHSQVIRDPIFWVLLTGVLAPSFIGTSVFFHQAHLSEIKHWSRELFAGSIALFSVVSIVLSLAAGWLIDRFSARQLLPSFLVPMGLGCLVANSLQGPSTVIVFMLLLGISSGISNSLFGAVWPEVYGTRHLGAVRSMIMAAMVIASALGPGITGWLIDVGIGFEQQLVGMGVYCLATAVAMAMAARSLARRSMEKPLKLD